MWEGRESLTTRLRVTLCVSLELRLSFWTSWYQTAPPATVLLHKAEAQEYCSVELVQSAWNVGVVVVKRVSVL